MLNLLKSPTYLITAFGITLILFDIQFYLLKNLPGHINLACTPGAYFTTPNLLFAAAISIFTALNVIGMIEIVRMKTKKYVRVNAPCPANSLGTSGMDTYISKKFVFRSTFSASLSGIGIILATLTSFCTICVLPVISLFGIGISLALFSTHLVWFKSLAVIFLAAGLYFTNNQLNNSCNFCVE
jgi:hypothetical protein